MEFGLPESKLPELLANLVSLKTKQTGTVFAQVFPGGGAEVRRGFAY